VSAGAGAWRGAELGAAALALAVLSISWGSIFVRLCAAAPLTVSFGRLAGAAALLLPWGAVSARRAGRVRDVIVPALAAGALLAFHFATWVASLGHTSVASSTVLVSTQPIFSVAFSWILLRERPGGRTLVAIGAALAGALLIAAADRGRGAGRLYGDLLALAGAVFAAAYFVIGRAARARGPFPVYLLSVNLSAAAIAGLLALFSGQPLLPARRVDLVWIAAMALVPHTLGHGALNWAVRRLRAYTVNLAVLGEPVLASLYALLLFGEAPPPSFYPGALLVLAGVAWAVAVESRRPGPAGATRTAPQGGL